MPAEVTPEQEEVMARYQAAIPVALRQRDEIVAFFDGFELLPPGVVDVAEWRPEPDDITDPADLVPSYAGVAIKP